MNGVKTLLLAAALSLFASRAHASYPPYIGNTPPANGIITQYVSGKICLAASYGTAGTCAILLDGTTGKVTGVSFSTTAVIGSTSAVYIDGSLYGAGIAGSPIGVRSSSVAVLNASGLIRNANLDSSSVTLQGNAFNAANQLVKLNNSAQLPAVDGSLLTGVVSAGPTDASMYGVGTVGTPYGVSAVSVAVLGATGKIPNSYFDSTVITQQGNTFNGVSQLVQTTGVGYLPALNGSLLTSVVPSLSVTAPITGAGPQRDRHDSRKHVQWGLPACSDDRERLAPASRWAKSVQCACDRKHFLDVHSHGRATRDFLRPFDEWCRAVASISTGRVAVLRRCDMGLQRRDLRPFGGRRWDELHKHVE